MVQRTQVELVDDLIGEVARETVRFGVDGTEYEIDLTIGHVEKLRPTLSEYVDRGRKAHTSRKSQAAQTASSTTSSNTSMSRSRREDTQQIRQWARENGYAPSSRGRITQSIVDAYTEAH